MSGFGDGRFDYQFSDTPPIVHAGRPAPAPVPPDPGPEPEPTPEPVPPQTHLLWGDPGALLVAFNAMQPFGYGLSTGGIYDADPYRNGGSDATVMPDDRLAAIIATGANAFRMAVDPGPMLAAASDAALDALIDQVLTGAARRVFAGFRVILDIHVLGLGLHPVAGWSASDLIDGPDGPKFTRLTYVLARLGAAMWARKNTTCGTGVVCLELFNEPPFESEFGGKEPWAAVQAPALHAAVRAVCGHTLLIGGNDFNTIDNLLSALPNAGTTALDPADFDPNTGFTFHPYESSLFTHQAVDGGFYEHVHGLKFPASDNPGGRSVVEDGITDAINADPDMSPAEKTARIDALVTNTNWSSSVAFYFANLGNKPSIVNRYAVLTAWADAHGVSHRRLMNTEHGAAVASGTPEDLPSLRSFVYANRYAAQQAGIGLITLHELQGSNFGVQQTSAPWTIGSHAREGLGLLPFETTTIENRLWPSNDLMDGVNWFSLGTGGPATEVTVTNAETGETRAWRLTSGTGFGGRGCVVHLAAGQWTMSAYMKVASGTQAVGFVFATEFSPDMTVTTTLTRFSQTFTVAASPPEGWNAVIYINTDVDGVEVDVDSVQINAGPAALQYIPTTDSPGSIEV